MIVPSTNYQYRELGRAIAFARKQAGLTQPELAARVHVSKGYVGHIELGRNLPSVEVLRDLARVLGVDYNELAALAGYVERTTGEAVVRVPPDEAADTRWFAALPAEAKRFIRRIGESALTAMHEAQERTGRNALDEAERKANKRASPDDRAE